MDNKNNDKNNSDNEPELDGNLFCLVVARN